MELDVEWKIEFSIVFNSRLTTTIESELACTTDGVGEREKDDVSLFDNYLIKRYLFEILSLSIKIIDNN